MQMLITRGPKLKLCALCMNNAWLRVYVGVKWVWLGGSAVQ